MTGREALLALASPQADGRGLLHNARYDGFGVEAYGSEAIAALFARADERFDAAHAIEAPGHVALFDGERALFADIAEGGIQRIWRLGPGAPLAAERQLSVAFHADLAQTPCRVFVEAGDHPALGADSAGRVVEAAAACTVAGFRTRAFVLRAFGDGEAGAALLALHVAQEIGAVRGFVHAAVHWADGAVVTVVDAAGLAALAGRPWTPRV